jgi:anti-sigma B factor antagonist
MDNDTITIKDSLFIGMEKNETDSAKILLNLKGFIDTYNSADFQREVNKLIEAGFIWITFNCSELDYVSSTGIGAFTSFLKSVALKKGDIVLTNLQPMVYSIFQIFAAGVLKAKISPS